MRFARIVEAIDRDNPMRGETGLRDHLADRQARGCAAPTCNKLEFADFDWPGNQLLVTQAKTGDPVQLPLLKDVGGGR